MSRWRYLPNVLTAVRLILTPFVIRAILGARHAEALWLFAIAASTDLLDGGLARRLGSITATGAYLDPIADKLLMSGVYISLAAIGNMPWWFVGLIFARDVLILAGAGVALWLTSTHRFAPSVWGKASTFMQVLTAVAWMAHNVLRVPALEQLAAALIWPAAGLTIWSGLHYARRGWRLARVVRVH